MTQNAIRYEKRDDGIAVLTLDRPDRLNALSGPMLKDLKRHVRAIAKDPDVRVYLLRGAPRADGRPCFSAGVDVRAYGENEGVSVNLGFELTNLIDDLLKPSIAVIDGVCSTGAVELALACDFRIVGIGAQISDWHLKKLGTGVGAWGSSTRWAREVGVTRAKEILMTGRVVDGNEAYRIGFASAVHESSELEAASLAMASDIASMDPKGVRGLLAHLDHTADMSRDQSLRWAQLSSEWLDVGTSQGDIAGRVLGNTEKDR
jgi:enoyl-CoA hydratase/carnithine racemase